MSEFKILKRAFDLYSVTIRITNSAPKKYRKNYVEILQELVKEINSNIFYGNEEEDKETKLKMFKKTLKDLKFFSMYTYRAEIDLCITTKQKCEIDGIEDEVNRMLTAIVKKLETEH